MDWGDVPTTAAVVVAVAAAAIATWQAAEARKSRRATQQQAAEATRARIAAEHQANEATTARKLTEEALVIAKQTEADRIADRHARDAPDFDIVSNGRDQVRVTLKGGPPEVVVRMTRLDIVAQGAKRLDVPITLPLDIQPRRLAPGGSCLMAVDVQIEKSSCSVRIELSSEEVDGGRTWPSRREVEFPAPVPAPQMSRATSEIPRHQQPGNMGF